MAFIDSGHFHLRCCAILLVAWMVTATQALSMSNTILVFARDTASSYSLTSGFNGYGIPYQLVLVPQSGVTLPVLNSSFTQGNYGGFVVLSEVSYDYGNNWSSALTPVQWQQLYDYQTTFGARMVRLDVYPGPGSGKYPVAQDNNPLTSGSGTTTAISGAGCCDSGVEQLVSISNATGFPTANLKT
jgi:hypothetical protein